MKISSMTQQQGSRIGVEGLVFKAHAHTLFKAKVSWKHHLRLATVIPEYWALELQFLFLLSGCQGQPCPDGQSSTQEAFQPPPIQIALIKQNIFV